MYWEKRPDVVELIVMILVKAVADNHRLRVGGCLRQDNSWNSAMRRRLPESNDSSAPGQ